MVYVHIIQRDGKLKKGSMNDIPYIRLEPNWNIYFRMKVGILYRSAEIWND